MADNYLEKRYDAVFGKKTVTKRVGHTLDELLLKNRSTRGYNKSYVVSRNELQQIVAVNTKIGSGCNRQVLRFRLVTQGEEATKVLDNIKMGAALPELHLPLGMSLQTMMLKATEMGLSSLIIGAFNKSKLKESFALPYEPVAILCVGKGAEKFELVPIKENESHSYYRKNGIHYVPKVVLEDLILS